MFCHGITSILSPVLVLLRPRTGKHVFKVCQPSRRLTLFTGTSRACDWKRACLSNLPAAMSQLAVYLMAGQGDFKGVGAFTSDCFMLTGVARMHQPSPDSYAHDCRCLVEEGDEDQMQVQETNTST